MTAWFTKATAAVLLGLLPLLTAVFAPTALLPLAVLYIPPLAFAVCVHKYTQAQPRQSKVDQDMLVRLFVGGFIPGVVIAMLVEILLTAVGGLLFLTLGDKDDVMGQMKNYQEHHRNATSVEMFTHVHIRHSISVVLGLLFMSFIVAGSVEEFVKYWLVKGRCCFASGLCVPQLNAAEVDPFFTVLCFAAAGCGFATMENISYTFVSPILAAQLWTAIIRDFLSTPLHMVCACITGVRLVISELNQPAVPPHLLVTLYPAILLHGLFDFQAFLFAFWTTDSEILSLCASILCLVIGLFYLHRLRSQVNWDYRVLDDMDQTENEHIV